MQKPVHPAENIGSTVGASKDAKPLDQLLVQTTRKAFLKHYLTSDELRLVHSLCSTHADVRDGEEDGKLAAKIASKIVV